MYAFEGTWKGTIAALSDSLTEQSVAMDQLMITRLRGVIKRSLLVGPPGTGSRSGNCEGHGRTPANKAMREAVVFGLLR